MKTDLTIERNIKRGMNFLRTFAEKYKEAIFRSLNPNRNRSRSLKSIKHISKKARRRSHSELYKIQIRTRDRKVREKKKCKISEFLSKQERELDFQISYRCLGTLSDTKEHLSKYLDGSGIGKGTESENDESGDECVPNFLKVPSDLNRIAIIFEGDIGNEQNVNAGRGSNEEERTSTSAVGANNKETANANIARANNKETENANIARANNKETANANLARANNNKETANANLARANNNKETANTNIARANNNNEKTNTNLTTINNNKERVHINLSSFSNKEATTTPSKPSIPTDQLNKPVKRNRRESNEGDDQTQEERSSPKPRMKRKYNFEDSSEPTKTRCVGFAENTSKASLGNDPTISRPIDTDQATEQKKIQSTGNCGSALSKKGNRTNGILKINNADMYTGANVTPVTDAQIVPSAPTLDRVQNILLRSDFQSIRGIYKKLIECEPEDEKEDTDTDKDADKEEKNSERATDSIQYGMSGVGSSNRWGVNEMINSHMHQNMIRADTNLDMKGPPFATDATDQFNEVGIDDPVDLFFNDSMDPPSIFKV